MTNQTPQQNRLERITHKWWFFVLFVLLIFVAPPYASKGYNFPEEWGTVALKALGNSILWSLFPWNPLFKATLIILVVLVIIIPKKVMRTFNIYVAAMYALNAVGSIGVTKKYGVVICTINLLFFAVIAVLWAWEAYLLRNDFTQTKQPIWKYWVVPLALLAFWYPINLKTGRPDFNPAYLITSPGALAFCLVTPVYLGLLTLYFPKVNIAVLRVTSLVGVFIGLANVILDFVLKPSTGWWNGVLHLPLLAISLYGLILSLKGPNTKHNYSETSADSLS